MKYNNLYQSVVVLMHRPLQAITVVGLCLI